MILQFLYWQQSYLKSIYRLEIWRFVFSFHFLRFTRISSNLSTEILKPLFFRLVPLSPSYFYFFFLYLNSSSNFLILILIFHKIWKAKKNWFLLLILSDKKKYHLLYTVSEHKVNYIFISFYGKVLSFKNWWDGGIFIYITVNPMIGSTCYAAQTQFSI